MICNRKLVALVWYLIFEGHEFLLVVCQGWGQVSKEACSAKAILTRVYFKMAMPMCAGPYCSLVLLPRPIHIFVLPLWLPEAFRFITLNFYSPVIVSSHFS